MEEAFFNIVKEHIENYQNSMYSISIEASLKRFLDPDYRFELYNNIFSKHCGWIGYAMIMSYAERAEYITKKHGMRIFLTQKAKEDFAFLFMG